jgi:hypothetical protein
VLSQSLLNLKANYPTALAAAEDCLARTPESLDCAVTHAAVLGKMGQHDLASYEFRMLTSHAPNYFPAHYYYAEHCSEMKLASLAAFEYERALDAAPNPDLKTLVFRRALESLTEARDFLTGKGLLEKYKGGLFPNQSPDFYVALARFYQASNDETGFFEAMTALTGLLTNPEEKRFFVHSNQTTFRKFNELTAYKNALVRLSAAERKQAKLVKPELVEK